MTPALVSDFFETALATSKPVTGKAITSFMVGWIGLEGPRLRGNQGWKPSRLNNLKVSICYRCKFQLGSRA